MTFNIIILYCVFINSFPIKHITLWFELNQLFIGNNHLNASLVGPISRWSETPRFFFSFTLNRTSYYRSVSTFNITFFVVCLWFVLRLILTSSPPANVHPHQFENPAYRGCSHHSSPSALTKLDQKKHPSENVVCRFEPNPTIWAQSICCALGYWVWILNLFFL